MIVTGSELRVGITKILVIPFADHSVPSFSSRAATLSLRRAGGFFHMTSWVLNREQRNTFRVASLHELQSKFLNSLLISPIIPPI